MVETFVGETTHHEGEAAAYAAAMTALAAEARHDAGELILSAIEDVRTRATA